MKKLMFAAALAAAFAGQSYGVESGVVGYQSIAIPVGYSMFTVTFKDIATTQFDMSKMVLLNKDGVKMDDTEDATPAMRTRAGDIYFQKVGADGNMTDTTYDFSTRPSKYGWLEDGSTLIEEGELLLESGEGVYINNAVANGDGEPEAVKFQVSGEVEINPMSMELKPGYSIIGNMTPNRVDISKLVLLNKDKVVMDDTEDATPAMRTRAGDIYFQKVGEDGNMTDTTYDFSTRPSKYGWLEDGSTLIGEDEVYLEPGEAVYINNAVANGDGDPESVFFQFPSPIVEK